MYSSSYFKRFVKERNVKDSTVKGYVHALRKYTNFHGLSLDNLIVEALNDEQNNVLLKNRSIKSRLLDFRNFLIDDDLSSATVKCYFSKIRTFYRHFEVELPNLPVVKYDNKYEVNYFDLPTKKHIAKAVEISPIDFKAVILFMSSSGTAKAEMLSLNVDDFIKATSQYHNGGKITGILKVLDSQEDIVPTFYLKRQKTGKFYYTFCSPEATSAIIKYLKTRPQLQPKDKLFNFSHSQILSKFNQINDKLGWGFKGNYRFFRSHTLRKFHASNIGLGAEYVDALQGRGRNTIHETYIKFNPQELKKVYMSTMENVMITPKKEEVIKNQEFTIIINIFLSGKEYNIL